MTALDHAALRALAEAATPGPWTLSADGPPPDIIAGMSVVACTLPSDRTRDEDTANAAYIAAANPAAVLALLDEVERLREALDKALPCLVAANTVSVREIYAAKALALVALKDPHA